jgi:hypothetical protein
VDYRQLSGNRHTPLGVQRQQAQELTRPANLVYLALYARFFHALTHYRAKPAQAALQPTYYTRRFPAERKQDMFCPVLVPARSFTDLSAVPGQDTSSSDPIPCFANLSMSAALISPGTTLATRVYGKKAYLHLVMRSGYVTPESGMARGRLVIKSDRGDVVMHEGDGAKVVGPGITGKACELVLTNDGESMAELILIDA